MVGGRTQRGTGQRKLLTSRALANVLRAVFACARGSCVRQRACTDNPIVAHAISSFRRCFNLAFFFLPFYAEYHRDTCDMHRMCMKSNAKEIKWPGIENLGLPFLLKDIKEAFAIHVARTAWGINCSPHRLKPLPVMTFGNAFTSGKRCRWQRMPCSFLLAKTVHSTFFDTVNTAKQHCSITPGSSCSSWGGSTHFFFSLLRDGEIEVSNRAIKV